MKIIQTAKLKKWNVACEYICVELSMSDAMNKKDIITQNVSSNKECYV